MAGIAGAPHILPSPPAPAAPATPTAPTPPAAIASKRRADGEPDGADHPVKRHESGTQGGPSNSPAAAAVPAPGKRRRAEESCDAEEDRRRISKGWNLAAAQQRRAEAERRLRVEAEHRENEEERRLDEQLRLADANRKVLEAEAREQRRRQAALQMQQLQDIQMMSEFSAWLAKQDWAFEEFLRRQDQQRQPPPQPQPGEPSGVAPAIATQRPNWPSSPPPSLVPRPEQPQRLAPTVAAPRPAQHAQQTQRPDRPTSPPPTLAPQLERPQRLQLGPTIAAPRPAQHAQWAQRPDRSSATIFAPAPRLAASSQHRCFRPHFPVLALTDECSCCDCFMRRNPQFSCIVPYLFSLALCTWLMA